jgi:hypothetical protein
MGLLSLAQSFWGLIADVAVTLEFNNLLIPRGWIAHGWIDLAHARQALKAARRGDWEASDNSLVEAFTVDAIRFNLTARLRKLRIFKPREELALLALADYEAERFHACIPVTLSILDGMGKDEFGQNILRHGVQLASLGTSFLEIGPGLTQLLRLLCTSRNKTSTARLDIPYRHGILHGVDLGYANRVVAAKTWNALIGFAYFVERRAAALAAQKDPPPPPPPVLESLQRAAETRRYWTSVEARLSNWRPRKEADVLASIATGTLSTDAPETTVSRLLDAWLARKPGIIAQLSVNWKNEDQNYLAGLVRRNLRMTGKVDDVPPPDSYEIISTEDVTVSHCAVGLRLCWRDVCDVETQVRLSHFVDGRLHPWLDPKGSWLVVALWPLESAVLSYITSKRGDE